MRSQAESKNAWRVRKQAGQGKRGCLQIGDGDAADKNSELAAFFGFPRRALYASHLLEQQLRQSAAD